MWVKQQDPKQIGKSQTSTVGYERVREPGVGVEEDLRYGGTTPTRQISSPPGGRPAQGSPKPLPAGSSGRGRAKHTRPIQLKDPRVQEHLQFRAFRTTRCRAESTCGHGDLLFPGGQQEGPPGGQSQLRLWIQKPTRECHPWEGKSKARIH